MNAEHDDRPLCPDCGYDLRGRSGPRCPECGLALEFLDAPHAAIPWVAARGARTALAYVQTVFLAIVNPRRICREIFRPIDHDVARRFRMLTVAGLTLVCAAGIAVALIVPAPSSMRTRVAAIPGAVAGALPPAPAVIHVFIAQLGRAAFLVNLALVTIGVAVGWLFLTAVPCRFFQARGLSSERQSRAVAISNYACAPLALVPLFGVATVFGAIRLEPADDDVLLYLCAAYAAAIAAGLALYWITLTQFARRTLMPTFGAWWVALLALPLGVIVGLLGSLAPLAIGISIGFIVDALRP